MMLWDNSHQDMWTEQDAIIFLRVSQLEFVTIRVEGLLFLRVSLKFGVHDTCLFIRLLELMLPSCHLIHSVHRI